jgi:type I restriction enzyme M protein
VVLANPSFAGSLDFENVAKDLLQTVKTKKTELLFLALFLRLLKPYAGVSTAISFFTKTNSGGTDKVRFYDMQADFSMKSERFIVN